MPNYLQVSQNGGGILCTPEQWDLCCKDARLPFIWRNLYHFEHYLSLSLGGVIIPPDLVLNAAAVSELDDGSTVATWIS